MSEEELSLSVAMAKRIELWPINRLQPYERNARLHSTEQVAQLAASITEFGFVNPILVDGKDGIIAGHGRLAAAKELALEYVPVVVLDHLSQAQRKAYVLADNRLAENAEWDEKLLQEELVGLDLQNFDLSLLGWNEEELAEIMAVDLEDETSSEGDGETRGLGTPIISYNIIFDDEQQQHVWFEFLKDLRARYPDDDTIAERIIRFIQEAK